MWRAGILVLVAQFVPAFLPHAAADGALYVADYITDACPDVPAAQLTNCDGCACCKQCDCCTAFHSRLLSLMDRLGLRVSGHLDQGINYASHGAVNPPTGFGNLPGSGFPYRANEYMLNQLYLALDRPADGSDGSWDFGGRVDLVYGTDYIFLRSRGLETEGDFSNRWNPDTGSGVFGRSLYGLAMPQMYAETARGPVRVRAGHFFSLFGHEQLLPTENFFYTTSYALFFNGYGESVPVTGLQVQYQCTDQVLVAGELHRGQSNWEDNNNHLNFMGHVECKNADGNLMATYSFDIGAQDDAGENTVFYQCVILQWQFAKASSYILNSSYGLEENVAADGSTAYWYGFANYLAHDINDSWTAGLRYELFDNVDGARTLQFAPFTRNAPGVYHAITGGLNYRPCKAVTFRPEVRWDWFDADGNVEPGPFGDGRSRFMFAVDALLMF